MNPVAPENDGSGHSGVSQRFPEGFVPGPEPIPVIDLVTSESGGEVFSGSEPSVNGAQVPVAGPDLIVPDRARGGIRITDDADAVPDLHPALNPDEQLPIAI